MNYYGGGIGGLIILIADVWAIINILQSSATSGHKLLWVVLVVLLPVIGFLFWLALGPRSVKA